MVMEAQIVYFDSPGNQNTDGAIEAVVRRVRKGDIRHVVVASSTGETGRRAAQAIMPLGARVVVVTSHCGFEKEGECEMTSDVEKGLAEQGVTVVRSSHILSGIERSITRKLGGASRVEAVAESLRGLFGQGLKVCVEVTVMAADNGAIPVGDVEVIAVGGHSEGADTACVVRPAHANVFFDLEVREILAIPRLKRSATGK